MHDQTPNVRIFATSSAGSVLWVVDQLRLHGPRWELLPAIAVAVATFVGALSNYLDRAQQRRHADMKFRAEHALLVMHGINPGKFPPGSEKLN